MPGIIIPHRGVRPTIHNSAFIAETAVLIGDVEVGPNASIWYGVVVRGDVNHISIGANTNVQDGTVVHCNRDPSGADYRESGGGMPTLIGDDITIGHLALIHACTLQDRCFIGMRSVVMDLVVVETGAMVAAGALVTPGKHVPAGELWAGSPARCLRKLGPTDEAEFARSARDYATLAETYRKGAEG